MLKMNYSDLAKKSYSQLIKECERRGIRTHNDKGDIFPANDLIGRIIAYDAYYEGRDDAINGRPSKVEMGHKDNRRKYCLRTDDSDSYFLKLTIEQYNVLDWCIHNEIDLRSAEVDEIGEVEWETP